MFKWIHKFGSPKVFYETAGKLIPWFGGATLLLMLYGLYGGLVQAPPDYQQKDAFRIIYVHVPSAWMSLFIYVVMAISGLVGFVWRIKVAEVIATASAPIGASFTALTLATGSIWGKPMWNTWWDWDARLTSELILLFLYLGYIGLQHAIDDPRRAARAGAILAMVGLVNIPIIHYSVEWWYSLHQGATVLPTLLGEKKLIDTRMLTPLLIMGVAFKLFYATVVLMRARNSLLWLERRSSWVKQVVTRQ